MDDALQTHLAELEELIGKAKADGQIDDTERADLAALVERVRDDLAAAEPDHEGLNEWLSEAAVRFEADHPSVASVLRSVSHALSGYGI